MLEEKRKPDYLAQVSFAIFILEIMAWNLLPFSDQRHFKRGKYRKQTKFTEVTGSPYFLGHRKIVFFVTYNKCNTIE